MNTIVKPIALALLAISSSISTPASAKSPRQYCFTAQPVVAFSWESFSINLRQLNNTSTIRMLIEKPEGRALTITLRGPDGSQLDNFYAVKKSNRIDKDYNFTDAEQGIYTLVVSDGNTKVTKQINVSRIVKQEVTKLSFE